MLVEFCTRVERLIFVHISPTSQAAQT